MPLSLQGSLGKEQHSQHKAPQLRTQRDPAASPLIIGYMTMHILHLLPATVTAIGRVGTGLGVVGGAQVVLVGRKQTDLDSNPNSANQQGL